MELPGPFFSQIFFSYKLNHCENLSEIILVYNRYISLIRINYSLHVSVFILKRFPWLSVHLSWTVPFLEVDSTWMKPYTKSNTCSPIHEKCLGVSKPFCGGRPPIVQEGATNMELHSCSAYHEAEMTGVGNWGPVYEWPKKGRTGLRSSFVVGPLCKASSRELAVWTRNYHG